MASNRLVRWASRVVVSSALVLPVLLALPVRAFNPAGSGCVSSEDCSDGLFCNGAEVCEEGACYPGPEACEDGQVCNEESDLCVGVSPTPGYSHGLDLCDQLSCPADVVAVDEGDCDPLAD